MTSDYPWEPPLAGTEAEPLTGALDRLRTTFRWKADGLDTDGLQTRIGTSSLTLGGLLKHLAAVEDYTFTTKLMIEEYGRHTGHADLLREAADGLVGEDPPAAWQPTSGPHP